MICLFKPSTCTTIDGKSRIPILEIANSLAGTHVIQVILLITVITLVLKYSDRNPLLFLLLQTWCVISHLRPYIISIVQNVAQSLNT